MNIPDELPHQPPVGHVSSVDSVHWSNPAKQSNIH